jgi:putative oxidoreductase
MMRELLLIFGRILLALVFVVSGSIKLSAIATTTAYFTRIGLPAPAMVAWVVGLFEVLAGLLIVIGYRARWVAILLALFTAVATYLGHKFWAVPPEQYLNQLNHALKNVAIIGGLLLMAVYGPGRWSIDARRGSGAL